MSTDTRRPSAVRTTTFASVASTVPSTFAANSWRAECGELTVDDLSDPSAAQIAEVGDRRLVHPANRSAPIEDVAGAGELRNGGGEIRRETAEVLDVLGVGHDAQSFPLLVAHPIAAGTRTAQALIRVSSAARVRQCPTSTNAGGLRSGLSATGRAVSLCVDLGGSAGAFDIPHAGEEERRECEHAADRPPLR